MPKLLNCAYCGKPFKSGEARASLNGLDYHAYPALCFDNALAESVELAETMDAGGDE